MQEGGGGEEKRGGKDDEAENVEGKGDEGKVRRKERQRGKGWRK